MSAFTFDFDLEDDLDESFDAIPLQGSAAVPSVDKTSTPECASGVEIPAEEIPLSALVSSITIHHSLLLAASIIIRVLNLSSSDRQRSSPRSPMRSHTRL